MEVPCHQARVCDGSLAPEKRVPISFPGSLAAGGWLHESGLAQGQIQASKHISLASQQPSPAICGQPNAPLYLNAWSDSQKAPLLVRLHTSILCHHSLFIILWILVPLFSILCLVQRICLLEEAGQGEQKTHYEASGMVHLSVTVNYSSIEFANWPFGNWHQLLLSSLLCQLFALHYMYCISHTSLVVDYSINVWLFFSAWRKETSYPSQILGRQRRGYNEIDDWILLACHSA